MAEALYVGEATVKSHVGHVLMKLVLRDRVQAVIFGLRDRRGGSRRMRPGGNGERA